MNRFIRDFYIRSYLTISEVKNLPNVSRYVQNLPSLYGHAKTCLIFFII